MGFSTLDWFVVAIYLAFSVLIGASFFRKHQDAKDYLLAGRSFSWFPIAISIIATDLSALSYIGVPALVFKEDLKYMLLVFLFPLQMILVIVIFVSLLYKLNIYTVYGYLERRFNKTIRLFAALLFMGGRGAWLATMTYATAVVLAEITGMSTLAAVLICGLCTTGYTFLGGMEAVVWTDFMQFFVLVGGAVLILVFILMGTPGGAAHLWSVASATGHTEMFDFSFDFTQKYTFWGLIFGSLIYVISTYGTDQINVQRYFATKDLKSTIWATAGSAVLLVPVLLLLYAIGVGLVAYYHDHAGLAKSLTNADRILPHFTANVLPSGARGLVIAGLFAATMSSMSSGINALTTSTMKDVLEHFFPKILERELFWARVLSVSWGILATAFATLMISGSLTVIERFNSIYQLFAAPLAAIFLLGILTKRAAAFPVFIGAMIGFALTIYVANFTNIHWLWYSPIGCVSAIVIGYFGSFLMPNTKTDDGSTIGSVPLEAQ